MPSGTLKYLTIFECNREGTGCEYACKVVIGPYPEGGHIRVPARCPYTQIETLESNGPRGCWRLSNGIHEEIEGCSV